MKPNCSTCSHDKTPQCPYDKICRVENYDNLAVRYAIAQYTNIIGCLSHPQAREYLMRDTIVELERRIKDTTGMASARKIAGYNEALALIRGE